MRPRRTAVPARVALAVAVLAVAAAANPAWAQYFGRNKVQYESWNFQVLKTEHFDIYYYEEERAAAEQAGRMAERWYGRISKTLVHELRGRQPLILYASHPDFQQTNAIQGALGEGTGGVTEALKRRIVLPLAGSLEASNHVIGHELVHAFQFDVTSRGGGFAVPNALRLPLWFIEGMAEYLSIGPIDPHTTMWLRDAVANDNLPSVRDLSNPRFFPYRYGHAFWTYIAGRWGDASVGRALKAARTAPSAEEAIRAVTGIGPDSLTTVWHAAIRGWYLPQEVAAERPTRGARALVLAEEEGGRLNVSPALSPDGTKLIFLSEKDLFSIELFLADGITGQVREKITKTAVDPHFQSLQFIKSAGSWSPDSRRFVFAALSKGKPVLSIWDSETRGVTREIRFPELGEIVNPTWSPDGSRVAFSAIVGGYTDLFLVDLATEELERLTDDPFAALHPTFSPDGTHIAFVTDRFTTNLDSLEIGEYRLALYDMRTGVVSRVPAFDRGKQVNPQWSGDGGSLYFVSDRDGTSNVYRVEMESGALTQVTNVLAGVSGITAESPAISVSHDPKRLVFSSYEDGNYNLYSIDSQEILAGREPREIPPGVIPGKLPIGEGSLELARPANGVSAPVPHDTSFTYRPYRANLSLDAIAQPNFFVGAGASGFAVGGGAALFWSDMLGDHNLVTLLQANGVDGDFANNTAAIVAYENRKSRWNWGFAVGQVPFITTDLSIEEGTFDGEPAVRERRFRFWEINREIQGLASYPFSSVQRADFSLGYRNIDFAGEVETEIFSSITGELLEEFTEDLPSDTLESINLVTGSAALVYDTSIFGGTSPILGQRYRFELTGFAGGLNYLQPLADYRRYFLIDRPLNFAVRGLHIGRYGSDGEDSRLTDFFIGYPWLVRGYNDGSFEPQECTGSFVVGDCPAFDQLFGSRLAVANFELRLPVLGALGVLPSPGVPPVELLAFFDAGVAWTSDEEASFLGGGRDPVTSHGVGMRVNLLGIAIGEVDFVHPNDRPEKGWYWLFSLTPGF